MSCRVFSRNIELLMQELLIKQAKKSGLQKIELEYLQNKKNGFVKPLLAEIGYKITKNKNVWLFNVRSGAGGKPHNIILEK